MARRDRAALALGFALLAAMAVFSWRRMRVGSEITHFLPAGGDARLAYVSRAVAESDLSRTMVLAVEAPDADRAASGARALADKLRHHPEVAWLRAGVDPELERAFYDTYFPRRHAFLSERPEEELPPRLTDEGLTEAARAVRRALSSPMGGLAARVAGSDPLMGFAAQLARMRGAQSGELTVRDGQLVSPDGRHGVIFLATRHSAFDGARQRPLLDAIARAFDEVNRARGGALRLKQSGAHRIAVAAEAQIRGDTERIAALSSLGVVALFLLIHRSMRYLVLASLPIAAGMLVATTAGLAAFGRLHGLTLAFGASLIGVCFDYPVFLINHHTLRPAPDGPMGTMRRVWPALALGALTTMGGLAGLAWTSFPGLREVAVFATFGVGGALLATRFLAAPLLPREPIPVRFQRRLAGAVTRAVDALRRRRSLAAALPLAALALCAAGLPRLRWVDDARALTDVAPALMREEREVRALVSRLDEGRFVIALGDTDEEALGRNDLVAARLEGARRDGALGAFRSAHALLWSADLQRRNEAALRASPRLAERAEAAFEREGFRAGALDAFARDLAAPPPPPLTWEELSRGPLAALARHFRIRVGERVGYLTFLEGARDPRAIERAIAGLDGVAYFDQGAFLRETYGRYRRRTLEVLVAGLGAVLAMLVARYRRAGTALAAFATPALAGATALAVVGLAGIPANLMHLLGLLLVFSTGADYGIFVAETTRHPEATSETLLSVTVAWVSSLLSFGLLAASSNPSLRALGLTTGVGLTASVLLAPATYHLFTRRLP